MNLKKISIFIFMFPSCLYAAGTKYPTLPSFGKTSSTIAISKARAYRSVKPRSNGTVVKHKDSYAIVDNKKIPKCIFYLNYAEGKNVIQYANVGYVNFKCY